jgi:hypothetical protein
MSSHHTGEVGASNVIHETRETSEEVKLQRRVQNQQLLEQQKAREKAWDERQKRIQQINERNWEIYTQGRHRLITKDFQVIFKDGQCSICSSKIKLIDDDGYNPWIIGKYKDLTIPYDPIQNPDSLNYEIKHSCFSEDPQIMNQYLRRRVEDLETALKNLDKSIDARIKNATALAAGF